MYGSTEGEGESPSVELCPVSVVGHKEAVYTGCRLWLFSGARLRICAAQIMHVFQPYIFSLRPDTAVVGLIGPSRAVDVPGGRKLSETVNDAELVGIEA